jgi:hypothetical protein
MVAGSDSRHTARLESHGRRASLQCFAPRIGHCLRGSVLCCPPVPIGSGYCGSPVAGPDIFLGKTYAKLLGSFFIAFVVNKRGLLFILKAQPVERFLIRDQLWSL